MAFDLRKGDSGKQLNVSPKSMTNAAATADTPTRPARGRGRGWLWAIGGCLVLIALGAWFEERPSSKRSLGDSSGSPVGTTASPKPADQPATTAPPVAPKPQVGGPADQKSASAASSEKPPTSGTQKGRDVVTGRIPVKFPAGSASVTSMDTAVVDEILKYLSVHPSSRAVVSGYASSDGDLAMNTDLAKKRADAFKAYLVERGATAERIDAVGRGIDNPIAPNDSQEGRARNRRVEVKF